jgi:uridine phosphorylase
MEGVIDDLVRSNVVSAEMEASVLFTMARLFRLRSGCVCAILDNMAEVSRKGTDFDPTKDFEDKSEYIERACRTANDAVKLLFQWDNDSSKAKSRYWYPSLTYRRP